MIDRTKLGIALVAVLVVLAGCSGPGSGEGENVTSPDDAGVGDGADPGVGETNETTEDDPVLGGNETTEEDPVLGGNETTEEDSTMGGNETTEDDSTMGGNETTESTMGDTNESTNTTTDDI